jgi:Flp pilus assembly protein TadB
MYSRTGYARADVAKQRRRKKHRGTQAGTVRHRARGTSRGDARATAEQRRIERMNRPPSWRSATNRAALAAAVFLAVLVLLLHTSAVQAVFLATFMFLIYIPMGYSMDSFIYRFRQRRKERKTAES